MIPVAGSDYYGDENQTFTPRPRASKYRVSRLDTSLNQDSEFDIGPAESGSGEVELGDFHDYEPYPTSSTRSSGLRSRSLTETQPLVSGPAGVVNMGSPDTHKMIPGYTLHHETTYCKGRLSATTLMVGLITATFVAVAIAAGFIIHMSIATHDTAVRVGVITDHFEATGALLALKDLTNDIMANHIPVIRNVIATVNHTAVLSKTLTSSILAINPAALFQNTSDAIQRVDAVLNTVFENGAIKISIAP